ncbi:molybdenum cofactor guanylyltransferase [Paenibacillus thermotolerans]|uniref:molybdenum cofactor guanylyltransferase n=1 Tax=Paenibacillus thermotolerans TaxID=3027807 RepID=UPI002367BEC8|nr:MULTISPECIES: molybdenum cofactor guanylyltransferase [unclassified Paenibacillus]
MLRMGWSAIVLAGGKSRRMGQDKWMLTIGGETVLERLVRAVEPHVDQIVVVLEHGDGAPAAKPKLPDSVGGNAKVTVVRDDADDEGPLAGIEAGLSATANEYNLILASDLPFVRWEPARMLLEACSGSQADCAVSKFDGRTQPLFGAYRKETLPLLAAYRRGGGRKVMEWVRSLRYLELDMPWQYGNCLFNMNTPDDYELALRRLGEVK